MKRGRLLLLGAGAVCAALSFWLWHVASGIMGQVPPDAVRMPPAVQQAQPKHAIRSPLPPSESSAPGAESPEKGPEPPGVAEPRPKPPAAPDAAGVEPAPPAVKTPGQAMQDAAQFMLSRYRPPPAAEKEGRLDLRLEELVARYAPEQPPPGMVYAVSPGVMRLGYMLTAARFVELLEQKALEQLPAAHASDFLQRAGVWLQGLARCPQALEAGASQNAEPLSEPLSVDDCAASLLRIRELIAAEDQAPVEATAGELLTRLGGALQCRASALASTTAARQ